MDTKTLTDRLARRSNITRQQAASLMDALAAGIKDACCNHDSVALPGFGVLEPKKRAERVVVNPSSSKRMLIPPKIVVTFKSSQLLKQKLNI